MPTARDIMSKRFQTIDHEVPVSEAVLTMNEHSVSSVIVNPCSETDTYGILTRRDIVYKVVSKGLSVYEVKVHEAMTKPLVIAVPDLSVKHVARLMANCRVSRIPVLDDTKLVGIVRLADVLEDLHLIDSMR